MALWFLLSIKVGISPDPAFITVLTRGPPFPPPRPPRYIPRNASEKAWDTLVIRIAAPEPARADRMGVGG